MIKRNHPWVEEMAVKVRNIFGQHMLQFSDQDRDEAIIDCLIVLCIEVGKLRWLSVSTEELSLEEFDRIFKEGMIKYYDKEAKPGFGYKN